MDWRKPAGVLPATLRAVPPPTRRFRGAPGKAARSCALEPKQSSEARLALRVVRNAHAVVFDLDLPGPFDAAEEQSRKRGIAKLFEPRDGRVVWRPASGEHRKGPAGFIGRRLRRVAFLFGYFLFGHSKRK